jgi:hypothetical protein
MSKVTLWVPCASKRPESWKQVEAYMQTEAPEGVEFYWRRTKPGNVRVIWNGAIKEFLESDADWLWSVHDDVLYDPGTLVRLMSWDKQLVSALVFHRQSPQLPHIWKSHEEGGPYAQRIDDTFKWYLNHREDVAFGPHIIHPRPDDALAEVDFTSTSCTLINRKVLEGMREIVGDDWFKMDNEIAGGGEDRRFFEIAKQAGYTGYVDRSCVAGHIIGDEATGVADFVMWRQCSTFGGYGDPEAERKISEVQK